MEGFSGDIYKLCTVVFASVGESCTYFVPLLFFLRLGFGSFLGISASEVGKVVKGTIVYFILIYSFHSILEILFLIPDSIKLDMSFERAFSSSELLGNDEFKARENEYIPSFLRDLAETLISFFFYATRFFYLLFMMLLSSLAPIIFLLSCMLGIGMGVQIFFGLLISAAAWPIVWQGFDTLTKWVSSQDVSQYGAYSYEFLSYFMKVVGPVGLAFTALNSGPGKSLVSSTMKSISLLKPTSLGAAQLASSGMTATAGAVRGWKQGTSRVHESNKNISYMNRGQNLNQKVLIAGAKGALGGAREAIKEKRRQNAERQMPRKRR